MNTTGLTLRPAEPEDLGYIEALLARNGLPNDDVRSGEGTFYVAETGGDRIGAGGIEAYGPVGLLRSVVVEPAHRGEGHGAALCAALEARAAADGIESLYLLTTTAAAFFEARGYRELPRSEAPAAVRRTEQFADLCPDTAVCLQKRL